MVLPNAADQSIWGLMPVAEEEVEDNGRRWSQNTFNYINVDPEASRYKR